MPNLRADCAAKRGTQRGGPRELFVYGTLMQPGMVRSVLGRGCGSSPARLAGYERRDGRWPYVVPRVGAWVEGRLLTGLSVADFTRLDQYEAARPKPHRGSQTPALSARDHRRDSTQPVHASLGLPAKFGGMAGLLAVSGAIFRHSAIDLGLRPRPSDRLGPGNRGWCHLAASLCGFQSRYFRRASAFPRRPIRRKG
jgi:hypothetical protein